jgi:hypothetical protein
MDPDTWEVRAIKGEPASATGPGEPATGRRVVDGPTRSEPLAQILAEEPFGRVTADGAHSTGPCQAALTARRASAVIPTRCSGRPWTENTPDARAGPGILQATRRLGRTLWRT